ncbi:MAG: GNAT family N-acetyltransferase [Dehalococcoidales bacterium]|nr:MAG: GNAT family N-acetyltransferase [Dehalococcoidales bacterium]
MLSMRKAESEDIDALCDLMTGLAGHTLSREGMLDRLEYIEKSDIDYLFVCEEDNSILGLLGFRIRVNLEEVSKFGEISAIVVRPESQKMGVGRFMMDYADKQARNLGCKGMWLVSGFAREEEAHKFYKRLGYQVNGYRFIRPFE